MALVLKPVDVTISYFASYKEPQLSLTKEDSRIELGTKLLAYFGLRLNDLKWDSNSASDKYVSFSKFLNPAFFDMALGAEEVSASLRNPRDMQQIEQFFGLAFELFKEIPFKMQRYIVQQQNNTEGDITAFWQKLAPYRPEGFSNLINGKGVTYHLRFPDHNLVAYVTVTDSIIIQRGIFLYIQLDFFPNNYDPYTASKLAAERVDFILKELELSISREG